MGMSTHLVGIVPPDDDWKKMKAVWDACDNADVDIPKDVSEFFGGETPDPKGVIIDLLHDKKHKGGISEWHDEIGQGFEIEVSKLPPNVKTLRFYNSW